MMQAFPPGGGMPQHPGMHPGQQMPGGVQHPQSMGTPMQMHPGVAGPHGQQVSQAPMMGMQPGMGLPGGPSAHAMQHLAPQAGQMMHQQPGMPQNMSPAMMETHRKMMWQRQVMARQQQMGMHPGQQGGAMNPQHMAQMQAAQQIGLPPHMQAQMQMANSAYAQQQQMMMQEAQARQNQQQHMAAQQAHHLAMQQAHSQGSNQGHPSSQPGQPTQPPMRPASAITMTTGMEARPSPAPTAGPQGGPQPGQPQMSQPPSQPNQQPQTSGPQGPQAQNAPSQPQPNQGQHGGQQVGGTGQPQNQVQNRPQVPQNMQGLNGQQLQAVQHAAMVQNQQRAAQAHAARGNGQTLLQAFHFANKLGAFRADQQQNSIAHWSGFVQQHFTDDAIYRMVLRFEQDLSAKTFEVHAAGLPRYLYTQFESGIDQVQLVLDGNQEKKLSDTHTVVRADRSRMLHWFRDGTQLVWNGVFQVIYAGDKIETLSFENREHQTYYPRSRLQELCAQASPSMTMQKSPKMTKKAQAAQAQLGRQGSGDTFDLRKMPESMITPFGIHKQLQTQLELAETMNAMTPLIVHSREHPEWSVQQSLRSLVEQYQRQQGEGGNPQGQIPGAQPNGPVQGAFPPGGLAGTVPQLHQQQRGGIGASPAMSNANLPNGATPSPLQNHMAPPMQMSMSQTSHASGSNTSPNVGGAQGGPGNKRRRSTAAGIKGEDAEVNVVGGAKVKQSPRMGSGQKRMKGS